MQHDAVEQALMDVAVEVHHGHSFQKRMDGEADEQAHDRVVGVGVLFALVAVVVSVLGTFGEVFKEELYEESGHDRGGNLEMDARCDKLVGGFAHKHVGYEVDEAGGEEERAAEHGGPFHNLGRYLFPLR